MPRLFSAPPVPLLLSFALGLGACAGAGDPKPDSAADGGGEAAGDGGAGGDGGGADGGGGGPTALGACDYVNPFSRAAECKAYTGSGWDEAGAQADCASPLPGATPGALRWGEDCDRSVILGECAIATGEPEATVLVFPGDDPSACSGTEIGCTFAGGVYTPAGVCAGGGDGGGGDGGSGGTGAVFVPFEQVCVEPLAGEPAGASDGEVCTWQAISACTEPGRKYTDYASCEPVFTQRPYWPGAPAGSTSPDDPRLDDPAYQAELGWVTEQVEACACTCCHSVEAAPAAGPSGWFLEDGPIWVDGLDDDGLAVLAGWVDSTAFGAFDAADNNGFDRSVTGLPTSDVPRMQAFLEAELRRRGLDRDDFAAVAPFGGPLYDQLFYEPSACLSGQGIDGAGALQWTGGGARYVYVLLPESQSPGVPPNLDLPEGTLWRVDVAPTDAPIDSGLRYGETPAGATQVAPVSGAPTALISGQTYYLVALRDVYQPITRCLFVAP